jgi:hypothetical protein
MAHGVASDVPQASHEVTIGQNWTVVEAAPEEVSLEDMSSVDRSSEVLVDALEPRAQVWIRRAHEKVNVVRHEAESEHAPAPIANLPGDQLQIVLSVAVVVEQDAA